MSTAKCMSLPSDLLPTLSTQRTFTAADYAALWVTLVISITTYYLAASLVDLGEQAMDRQAVATAVGGSATVLISDYRQALVCQLCHWSRTAQLCACSCGQQLCLSTRVGPHWLVRGSFLVSATATHGVTKFTLSVCSI